MLFCMSICLLYLNSSEVLLSDLNKKTPYTVWDLALHLQKEFQNTSPVMTDVVPAASNINYIYSPENSDM